ncbi:MAG TPA: S1/P1 nuclease [Xanthomonadaceae bacterium]|nr:S1/P1 nuclease [Xanthomonadaceae bacterium]
MRPWLALSAAILALALPPAAGAFGGPAHRMVGEIAEQRLSAPVRGEVHALLEGEPVVTLAGISTWADEVRAGDDPRFEGTARWHYINFPREDACRYLPERDCPSGACIVEALRVQAAILGDRERSIDSRREALKWVVHLVGDIHQPLHTGFGDDRGGNLFQLNYIGQGTNLHAVWDRLVFEVAGLSEDEHVAELKSRALPDAELAWHAGAAAAWAEESCHLIESLDLYPRRPGRLSRAYLERMRPHAEARVQLAAARLAGLLEAVLDEDPHPDP